jgi:hypothetical protein
LEQPLASVEDGACFDGLLPTGTNRNQGAESMLAYLWTELHQVSVPQAMTAQTETVVAGG